MCSKPAMPERAGLRSSTAHLRAAAQVLRPANCAITFSSVLLGGWLGSRSISPPLLLAALSASLIMAGGNALNDLCDIEADRINKPDRPLPTGRLPAWAARLQALLLSGVGLLLGLLLPHPAPLIAALAVGGLIAYNVWIKGVPLAGNLVVSLLCGLAILYGGAAVEAWRPAWIPAGFALLYHLGREVLKDVEDREGDRRLRGSTLPLSWGRSRSLGLVTGVYLALVLLTPLPFLYRIYGLPYLGLVLLLDGLLLYVLFALWRSSTADEFGRLGVVLKAGMVIGLCAIFCGGL